MKPWKREQILLVLPSDDLAIPSEASVGQLYERMLRSEGYAPQVCTDREDILNLIANSLPHLIIWYLKPNVYEDVSKTLRQIHQMYNEFERPLIFLLVSTIHDIARFGLLADKVMEFLIDKNDLLSAVENLLLSKGGANKVKPN
jgi:DNA-binding response OmpR family regulator